ncbi:hypothetical protein SRS16CHR_02664 [Variovorax sp. SRS16]|nr:hypothetical protein SRS16CHR_02664 [Variovorax sp. SRS16]
MPFVGIASDGAVNRVRMVLAQMQEAEQPSATTA